MMHLSQKNKERAKKEHNVIGIQTTHDQNKKEKKEKGERSGRKSSSLKSCRVLVSSSLPPSLP